MRVTLRPHQVIGLPAAQEQDGVTKSKSKDRSRLYEARIEAAIENAQSTVASSRKKVAKARDLCEAAREAIEKSKAKRRA